MRPWKNIRRQFIQMNANISIDAYTVNMLFSKQYNVEPLKKEEKKNYLV